MKYIRTREPGESTASWTKNVELWFVDAVIVVYKMIT